MRFASLHFPHHLALVFFLVLLLAVAVGGCTRPPQPKTELTAKVQTALASEAGLKTLKINIDANGGVVTLRGQVESDEVKKHIQEVAQTVKGVTWVQNQLSVAPRSG